MTTKIHLMHKISSMLDLSSEELPMTSHACNYVRHSNRLKSLKAGFLRRFEVLEMFHQWVNHNNNSFKLLLLHKMNSISRSFPGLCRSEVQSIHNNSISKNTTNHNSESSQFQSESSLPNRSLNDAQNSSENHSQTLNVENLREDLFQNNQWTPNYSNINPSRPSVTSEERQNYGERQSGANIFTIPVLPNYSDLWAVPVLPPYPPPKYPDPPRYDAVVTIDGDGFEATATSSSSSAIPFHERNTLTTTSGCHDDDDDDVLVMKTDGTTYLACLVCWFCGFLFGGVAFLAAGDQLMNWWHAIDINYRFNVICINT